MVLVSRGGQLAGLIAIADEVRAGAVEALQRLSRAGVRTVMLTGDNERRAPPSRAASASTSTAPSSCRRTRSTRSGS